MPLHVTELRGKSAKWHPNQLSWHFGGSNYDVRPYWSQYMDINFFNCPMLPEVDYSVSRIPLGHMRIYMNYFLAPGFFHTNFTEETQEWSDTAWTKSTRSWNYAGKRMGVIAGDIMKRIPGGNTSINHAANHDEFDLYNRTDYDRGGHVMNTYAAWGLGYDARKTNKVTANYVFRDGSVGHYRGNDGRLIEVQPVDLYTNVTFLMPVGH
jgi:hypothetical protein